MKTRLDIILETVTELFEANRGTMVQRAERTLGKLGGPDSEKGRKYIRNLRKIGMDSTAREIAGNWRDAEQSDSGDDDRKAAGER